MLGFNKHLSLQALLENDEFLLSDHFTPERYDKLKRLSSEPMQLNAMELSSSLAFSELMRACAGEL